MSIKLGSVRAVVVSSPRAAELFLKTHDHVFASRPKTQAAEIVSYGSKAVALTPYGTYWRNVRKLCAVHLLSTSKMEQFKPTRTKMIGLMVDRLRGAGQKEEVVNVSEIVAEVFEKLLYRTILGSGDNNDDDHDDHADDDMRVKEILGEMVKLGGAFNVSDYLPLLASLDLQGLAQRMRQLSESMDKILERIIEKHGQEDRDRNLKDYDFVDILRSKLNQPINPQDQNSEVLGRTHVKAILIDMMVGAQDTSAVAIDWIFSEILKNPLV
ncbi:PREDICTED: cytochrome P450 CYP736A12-like [Tarenaya hassleriana]|uniref:cytochrome P450 CYP736A12-like n=1 Tax=Tarenaya hassleriana TaxID=28532 RepID=UPI00053C2509|nr:PREDICTED: cytochrome P450 CYP736A12-like [Tarenaya hassleriana]